MSEESAEIQEVFFIGKSEVVFIILFLLFVKIVAGLPQHTDLTLNTDDTFRIDVYGIPIKGNFDETDTEYNLYFIGFGDTHIGLTMLKTDNEHIVDKPIGVIKLMREKDSISEYPHVAKPVKFMPNY